MPTSPSLQCAGAGDHTYCVSSVLPPQYGFTYGPNKLTDGRLDTAWVPAGSADGIGDWIAVNLGEPRLVPGLLILNGYHKNQSIYEKNNRVRDYEVRTSSGWSRTGTLDDSEATQTIKIDDPAQVRWVQLIINSVYRGGKYRDTAVTELRVLQ